MKDTSQVLREVFGVEDGDLLLVPANAYIDGDYDITFEVNYEVITGDINRDYVPNAVVGNMLYVTKMPPQYRLPILQNKADKLKQEYLTVKQEIQELSKDV